MMFTPDYAVLTENWANGMTTDRGKRRDQTMTPIEREIKEIVELQKKLETVEQTAEVQQTLVDLDILLSDLSFLEIEASDH